MKTLDHKTYYELLEVPTDAGAVDIKRAYQDALATYGDDALVTYSLFSDEQREEILRMIECAFDTLMDEDKRSQYNRQLHNTHKGIQGMAIGQKRTTADPLTHALNNSRADSLETWVRMKSGDEEIKAMACKLLDKDRISGIDLKKIRIAYGIELSEIYEVTRISRSVLTDIEQDRHEALPAEIYLKRFLRAYAELLQIDPQPIVDGYLKNMA